MLCMNEICVFNPPCHLDCGIPVWWKTYQLFKHVGNIALESINTNPFCLDCERSNSVYVNKALICSLNKPVLSNEFFAQGNNRSL